MTKTTDFVAAVVHNAKIETEKNIMQFPGFWISGDAHEIVITSTNFDDTELTEHSDWKAAHQNDDPALPHGFVQWEDAVLDMQRRLKGEIACTPIRSNDND